MEFMAIDYFQVGQRLRAHLSLSQIKSDNIGGVARRELGDKECFRPVRRRARPARPSPRSILWKNESSSQRSKGKMRHALQTNRAPRLSAAIYSAIISGQLR